MGWARGAGRMAAPPGGHPRDVHPVTARTVRCAQPLSRDAARAGEAVEAAEAPRRRRSCDALPLRSALVRHGALRRVLR